MKWPRKVFFLLWLVLVVWLVIWLYPFVHAPRRFPRLSGLPRFPQRLRSLPFPQAQRQAPEARLVLGTSHGKEISLSEKQQESNVIAVAPIGAGKTARIVIPNLLEEPGSRSLLISDVKGELVRLTAGAVSRYHEVWVFAPHKPGESDG